MSTITLDNLPALILNKISSFLPNQFILKNLNKNTQRKILITRMTLKPSSTDFNFPDSLTYLNCNKNKYISEKSLENLNLIYLNISYLQISQILSNPKTLKKLLTSHNFLISNQSISNFDLETLNISHTNITQLPKNKSNLRRLSINGNVKLKNEDLQNLKLTYLSISQNPNITELLCDKDSLEHLFIISTKITSLKNFNLKYLFINSEIRLHLDLKNIQHLSVPHNTFIRNEDLKGLKIKYLNIFKTKITEILSEDRKSVV